MKKTLIFCFMLLSMPLVLGQTTKKVAILETVDREDVIPYAVKLIIRSNLAKAITNTPGYEAFDRTDMDAILGEQNFQRTGMVSNEQIKRLGEMTGAAYVLVAEAVKADSRTMYIMAKLLDVETGRIEATDNQLMGSDAKQLQAGCELLSSNLLKDKIKVKAEKKEDTKEKNKADKKEKQKTNSNKKAKNIVANIDNGKISKIGGNKYMYGGEQMNERQLRLFLENNCKAAYKQYKTGSGLVGGGWATFVFSLVGIGGGLTDGFLHNGSNDFVPFSFNAEDYKHYDEHYNWVYYTKDSPGYEDKQADLTFHKKLTYGLLIGGAALFVTSVTLWSVGHQKKATAWKKYNEVCAPSSSQRASLDLKASPNQVGLVLNF